MSAVTGGGIATGGGTNARLAMDDDASGAFSTDVPPPSRSRSPPPPQRGRSVSSVTRSKNPSAIFRKLRVPHSSAIVSRRYPCDSSSSPVSPHSKATVSSVSANPNNFVHPSTRVCSIPSTTSTMAAGIGVDRVGGGRETPTHAGESSCQHRHAAVRGTFGTAAKSRRRSLVAPAARHMARTRTSSAHRSIVSSTSAGSIAGGSRVVSRSTAAHASTHSARRVRGLGSSHGCVQKFWLLSWQPLRFLGRWHAGPRRTVRLCLRRRSRSIARASRRAALSAAARRRSARSARCNGRSSSIEDAPDPSSSEREPVQPGE